jgi:Na+-translocating ferredoxin:NAD+ oxidoreductase RnfG subunit
MKYLPTKEGTGREITKNIITFYKITWNFGQLQSPTNMKTKNKRRKVRQQQKHTNQILGRILGEKNNRKLTLRHKKRKEYQPSFGNSVAKIFVRIKVRDPSVI